MFDFTNFHWNKEQTKGAPHFGTDGHGSVLFNGGILYWGGHRCFEFDENISWLDLNTMTWYSVGSKGEGKCGDIFLSYCLSFVSSSHSEMLHANAL